MIRSGEHMIFTARLLQIEFATTVRMSDVLGEYEKPLVRAVNQMAEAYAQMGRDMLDALRRAGLA